ncbi:MAG: NAD(P)H-dependent oxidoreductase subunit E [Actinobacteria bacterium]|nr:NAD(P)H-dependent oxidoreductase subunit E [Actinomycetota bacterium]
MPRRVVRTEQPVDGDARRDDLDLTQVVVIVDEGDAHGNLIALLQRTQNAFGSVPEPAVDEIARLTGVPASRIYGIITFYAQFSTVPSGRRKIFVCHGTACHVAGATRITEALEQELDVPDGKSTADMEFSLGSVACMGACSQAPVMRIDEETYDNLSADHTRKVIRELVKELGLEARYPGLAGAGSTGRGGGDD